MALDMAVSSLSILRDANLLLHMPDAVFTIVTYAMFSSWKKAMEYIALSELIFSSRVFHH